MNKDNHNHNMYPLCQVIDTWGDKHLPMWYNGHHNMMLGIGYAIADDEYEEAVEIIEDNKKDDNYYDALATVIMYETVMPPHECYTYKVMDFDGIGGTPPNDKLGRMFEWCQKNKIACKLVYPGAFLFNTDENMNDFLAHWFK